MGWCVHQPVFSNICCLCMCTCVHMPGVHRLGVLWIFLTPHWGIFHSGMNLSKINIFTSFFLPPDQVFQHTPVIDSLRCTNQTKAYSEMPASGGSLEWLSLVFLQLFPLLFARVCCLSEWPGGPQFQHTTSFSPATLGFLTLLLSDSSLYCRTVLIWDTFGGSFLYRVTAPTPLSILMCSIMRLLPLVRS